MDHTKLARIVLALDVSRTEIRGHTCCPLWRCVAGDDISYWLAALLHIAILQPLNEFSFSPQQAITAADIMIEVPSFYSPHIRRPQAEMHRCEYHVEHQCRARCSITCETRDPGPRTREGRLKRDVNM